MNEGLLQTRIQSVETLTFTNFFRVSKILNLIDKEELGLKVLCSKSGKTFGLTRYVDIFSHPDPNPYHNTLFRLIYQLAFN